MTHPGCRRAAFAAQFFAVLSLGAAYTGRPFGGAYPWGRYGYLEGVDGWKPSPYTYEDDLENPYSLYGVGRHGGYRGYSGGRDHHPPSPCPEYKTGEASRWRDAGDGSLVAFVALPGVAMGDRQVWLDSDGRTVRVRAARALPAHGRACLPRNAQISRDGRSELLEFSVPVPSAGVASRAVVRDVRGGIALIVPRARAPERAPRLHERESPQDAKAQEVSSLGSPGLKIEATPVQGPVPEERAAAVKSRQVLAMKSMVVLPPSDGVEVIEEAWPEPEKQSDAAEGWWDNRGDFHAY